VDLWDNARFAAIALMVAGHAMTKMVGENDAAFTVYVFIYAFHVPVFVAVSGYFAKASAPDENRIRSLLTDLILPYLVFETIWSVIHWIQSGTPNFDYFHASWTLWFLIALAIWRLVLPYLAALRWPLIISIILSIAAGYFAIDQTLSMARVLGFLPFFVLGWKLREWRLGDKWVALSKNTVLLWRIGALGAAIALAVFIALNVPWLREIRIRNFLTFDAGYASFGYDQWWAGLGRLAVMAVAAVMIVAFLVLIPRRHTWMTSFGQATMYIYLLHTFVLYPLRENGFLDGEKSLWFIILVLLGSVLLSVALGSKPVRWLFRPLVEPKPKWLFAQR